MASEAERCASCDDPTGRAGAGDDSLYVGDAGPLCQECYDLRFAVTPPPAAPAGDAFAEAVDALVASVGGEYPGDRETAARAAVLAAHAAAVAEAEARGRAAALREVDEAVERLMTNDLIPNLGYSSRTITIEREQWDGNSPVWTFGRNTDDIVTAPTPHAALLAAARALSQGDDAAESGVTP